nr:MAG: hypothetical protein [Microvirus Sku218]
MTKNDFVDDLFYNDEQCCDCCLEIRPDCCFFFTYLQEPYYVCLDCLEMIIVEYERRLKESK